MDQVPPDDHDVAASLPGYEFAEKERCSKWLRGVATGLSNDIVTEDSAAQQFVELHGNDLRYCHTRAKWFHWDGERWAPDEIGGAFHWARELARRLAEDQDERKRYI